MDQRDRSLAFATAFFLVAFFGAAFFLVAFFGAAFLATAFLGADFFFAVAMMNFGFNLNDYKWNHIFLILQKKDINFFHSLR